MVRWAAILIGSLFLSGAAYAHSLRSGYFELNEVDTGSYFVVWKAPSLSGRNLNITPILPADCGITVSDYQLSPSGGHIETWQVICEQTLIGRELQFSGLETTNADVLVRNTSLGQGVQNYRATRSSPVFSLSATSRSGSVIGTYFRFGVEHILFGIDHLLFVLCLIFLIRGFGRLALTITSFTVAHSLTLAGTALGLFQLPVKPVEAVIALSIVLLAAEVLSARDEDAPRLSQRAPWVIAFTFGLLHGFGFASALSEIGLPQNALPTSLFAFNLGVEAGQLIFVGLVLLLLEILRRLDWQRPVRLTALYSTGIIASKWFIERMI